MAIVSNRYPLSTADGKYIPSDILRPTKAVKHTTSNSVGTTAKEIPSSIDLIRVRSSVDASIQFFSISTAATALVDAEDKPYTIILAAGEFVLLSPPIGYRWYSIINDSVAGVCTVESLECWNALALQSQITRR